MRACLKLLIAGCSAVAMADVAHADALDGDWCNARDGKLTIDGSVIITPKGGRVMGEYGRHRFEYLAPENDWHAGKKIVIQQFSETLMELTVEDETANQWKPCQVVS